MTIPVETKGAPLQSTAASAPHAIDLRASIPLPWGRYYVTILAGRERRNAARLAVELQTHWPRLLAVYFLLASIVLAIGIGYLVMIYLIKCALGINLMSDSSPLHFIYEIVFG